MFNSKLLVALCGMGDDGMYWPYKYADWTHANYFEHDSALHSYTLTEDAWVYCSIARDTSYQVRVTLPGKATVFYSAASGGDISSGNPAILPKGTEIANSGKSSKFEINVYTAPIDWVKFDSVQ